MNRAKKFIEQTAWYGVFSNSKVIVQAVSSVVLARLLTPEDFGLVAMIAVVVAFCSLFNDLGMSVAYIQRIEVTKEHTSAVFVQSATSGLLMALLIVSLQSQIAGFYGLPELAPIIVGMAASVFLSSLAVTPTAILRRDSRFKELGILGLIGLVISISVTIVMAIRDFGAMSIVYGVISKDVFTLAATSYLSRWIPSVSFKFVIFAELFRLGGWLSLTRFLGFFSRNLDTLLIGKYFGPVVLGIYNRAYAFMLLPLQKVGNVVAATSLPVLRDFQADNKKLARSIKKIVTAELVLLTPIIIYVWAERTMIVRILYGEQWVLVADYLTYLLPVVLLDLSRNALFQVFVIKGQTKQQFQLSVLFVSLVLIALVIGALSGDIMLLVLLYAVAKIIVWLPASIYSAAQMSISAKEVIKMQLMCFLPYWPLVALVIVQDLLVEVAIISSESHMRFAFFSLIFGMLTIYCITVLAADKRFLFLFETFTSLGKIRALLVRVNNV